MFYKITIKSFLFGLLISQLYSGVPGQQAFGQDTTAIRLKDDVQDLANVDFKTDVRIFVVMAALNASGFDFEIDDQEITGVRAELLRRLNRLPNSTFTELRLQYQNTNLWTPETTHAAYTSLALLLEGPPEFAYREQLANAPHGVAVIRGFETLLSDFYVDAGLEQLWREIQPQYQRELQLYRPVVNRMIREILDYFRIPARIYFDRNIVIIPDLLAYRDIVNARNVEDVYYIVVGPTSDPEKNYLKLQHEYLHFLLDPLIAENSELVEQLGRYLDASRRQPFFPEDLWNDHALLVTETLIETILFRLHPDKYPSGDDKAGKSFDLVQQGMILHPYFDRKLKQFESNTAEAVTLPNFLKSMLKDIPDEEIAGDLRSAEQMQAKIEEEEERLQEQIRLQKLEAEKQKLIEQAGSFIAAGELDQASDIIDQLLELEPDNGKGLFYLAQISARKGDWKIARELHRKTIESPGLDPWIYAHSLVQIGRINAAEGLYQEARQSFEAVLAMDGEIRESRQEAEFLLGKLPQ